MNQTFWQIAWLIASFLILIFFLISSFALLLCNIASGVIKVSPEKRTRVMAWFALGKGYTPEMHGGAILATVGSGFVGFVLLLLMRTVFQ